MAHEVHSIDLAGLTQEELVHTYNSKPGGCGICRTCGRDIEWHVIQSFAIITALRETLRHAPILGAAGETERQGWQIRLLSYRVLPMQFELGDRFSDETGEWEIATRPHLTAGGKSAHACVRRVDQPATMEDRMWVAHERIRVRAAPQRLPMNGPPCSSSRGKPPA